MKFVQAKKGVPEGSAAPLEHAEPIVHLEDAEKASFLAKVHIVLLRSIYQCFP